MFYFDTVLRNSCLMYAFNHISCDNIQVEEGDATYGAHTFTLNDQPAKFRVAKKTPIKQGCFVALWKRDLYGKSIPHDASDPFTLYIISVENTQQCGQFIFPKEILVRHNILSLHHGGGKRGFRLYPAWNEPLNQQAKKTQTWQLPYFFHTDEQEKTHLPLKLLEITGLALKKEDGKQQA